MKELGQFVLLIVSIVLQGLILKLLWIWFATPLHLPSITIPHALGISLIMSLLTHQARENLGMEKEITYAFVHPIMCLVIGFILKLMM